MPFYAEASVSTGSQPIKKAIGLINANRPGEAIRILSEYRPEDSELYSFHHAYAKAFEKSDRLSDSIAHFRLAYLYSQTIETKALTLYERAEAYRKMGYYSEASLGYKIFLRNFPDSRLSQRAHSGLAESLYRLGFFKDAVEQYESSGNTSRILYKRANALHSDGRIREAHDLYMTLIATAKNFLYSSPETVYNIGENFRLMNKLADAKIYLYPIKDLPIKYRADISLGLISLKEEKLELAVKSFRSALQSNERQLRRSALFHLADVYIKMGKPDEAKSRLLEIREKYPYGKEYDTALLMLSRLYRNEGESDRAVSLLKELVFRRTPDKNALKELETIILDAEQRNPEEFLKLWNSVGRWFFEPSRSDFLLKVAKGLRSEVKPFLELYAWLLKNGSYNEKVRSRLALANFFADFGDAETASKYIQGIQLKSHRDALLRIRAKIYLLNAEYQKASDAVTSIKNIKQDDIVLLSSALKHAKDTGKAVDFYERALNRAGGPAKEYIKLADMLYETGRRSDAVKYYGTAVTMYPGAKDKSAGTGNDMQWAYYRLSILSSDEKSGDALSAIRQGGDILSGFAGAGLKEHAIKERISRIF